MVDKIGLRNRIATGSIFLFLFATFNLLTVRGVFAAVGDCQDANLSFSQSTYKAGDRVTLNGSNASGTWTLCIYQGNERIAVTTNSTDNELSVNLPEDYTGEELTGVIRPNGICGNDLDSANNCRVTANDDGIDGDAAQTNDGQTDSGGVTNDIGGGSYNGGGGGGGVATKAANSSDLPSTNVENPLKTDDFTQLVGGFLNWLLGIAGSIALLILIYGGVVYISSAGDPQKAETGKRIVMWTLFGLIIVLVSYSIIVTIDEIFVS
jgi:hypothetical protein